MRQIMLKIVRRLAQISYFFLLSVPKGYYNENLRLSVDDNPYHELRLLDLLQKSW